MVLRNKKLGSYFESKTKQILETQGYYAYKTNVNDRNVDIFAFKDNTVYLFEVKSINAIPKSSTITTLRANLRKQMKKYVVEYADKMKEQGFNVKIGIVTWINYNDLKDYKISIINPEELSNEWIEESIKFAKNIKS